MAILKRRLKQASSDEGVNIVYLETSAELVKCSDDETVEKKLSDRFPTIPITWAAYQALSDEERNRNDIIYLVENAPRTSTGAMSAEWQTYTTFERAIGTWVDGRTIYRKVFVFTSPSNILSSEVVVKIVEDLEMISLEGVLCQGDGIYVQINNPSVDTENSPTASAFFVSGEGIHMYIGRDIYANKPVNLIFEYVKKGES